MECYNKFNYFLKIAIKQWSSREKTFMKTQICFQKTIIDNFDNI